MVDAAEPALEHRSAAAAVAIGRSRQDVILDVLIYVIFTVALLAVAYPIYQILIASVSDPAAVSVR